LARALLPRATVEYTTLNFNPPRVLAVPLSLSALPHFSTVLRKIFKLSRAAAASAEGAARRSQLSQFFFTNFCRRRRNCYSQYIAEVYRRGLVIAALMICGCIPRALPAISLLYLGANFVRLLGPILYWMQVRWLKLQRKAFVV